MKRSGTNPTAAAIATLKLQGTIGKNLREDVLAFLKDVRSDEGGFQANTRIPFADSLSTFTGYMTCLDLDERELIVADRIKQFIGSLEQHRRRVSRRDMGSSDRCRIYVLRAGHAGARQ